MPRFLLILFSLAFVAVSSPLRAETPALLEHALQKWAAAADDWAFTQRVRTFDEDKVKLERLERYDPSRPDNQRWELLEIDGQPPTVAQRERWQHRKNRKPKKKPEGTLEKYFDFDRATIAEESAKSVRYDVPLRKGGSMLVPLEKIEIAVTVDKTTRSIEQITGGLREPLRIALGLAKVTHMWLDVRFDPLMHDFTPEDGESSASGAAHAVVFKMGDRVEYAWSDFKRVTPVSSPTSSASPIREAAGL